MRREHFAPAAALAYMVLALSIIPYGIPVHPVYKWLIASAGVVMAVLVLSDPLPRRKSIAVWPPIAIVGAWGIACAFGAAPLTSLDRSYGLALYAFCFIAAQAIVWDPKVFRMLMWAVLLTVLACVADVGLQWGAGESLFTGTPKKHTGFHGSQGNQNDLACVSILLPLTSAALPGTAGVLLYLGMVLITAPVWVLSKSRQIALGWMVGAMPPLVPRVSRKWLVAIAIGVIGCMVIAVALSPELRARIALTATRGLGDRGPIFGFGLWLFTKYPFAGIGPALFGNFYIPAALSGWTWMGEKLQTIGMPWVHSLPIEVLCETGLVGASVMCAVLWAAVRRLRKAWKSAAADRTALMAVITAAGCMATIGLFDLSFIKDWVRVCFWMILGLCFAQWGQPESAAESERGSSPSSVRPGRRVERGARRTKGVSRPAT